MHERVLTHIGMSQVTTGCAHGVSSSQVNKGREKLKVVWIGCCVLGWVGGWVGWFGWVGDWFVCSVVRWFGVGVSGVGSVLCWVVGLGVGWLVAFRCQFFEFFF